MSKIKSIAGASIIAFFLLFVTGKTMYLYIQKQKDYKRLIANQVKQSDSLKYYRDRAGHETAVSPVLEYRLNEALKILPEVQAELKELKIKAGRVETYTETRIVQNKDIKQALRDSTIYNQIPIKVFNYSDPWYKVRGKIQNDSITANIQSLDTLIQVVSRTGPRLNPWLWILSRRQLVQTIQSRNPSNKIVYSQYIQIKK